MEGYSEVPCRHLSNLRRRGSRDDDKSGSLNLGGAARSLCCEVRARGPSTLAVLWISWWEGPGVVEDGTTVLFGLPGVAVDRVEAAENGVRTVHLVTADRDAAACPACGVFSASVRQRRTTRPKDLPYGETPLVVRWHKAQYWCRESACPRTALTESIAELPPRARITGRCRRAAGAAVGAGRSVASVTEELAMSWPIVHAAFVAHADRLLVEPAAPCVLGIDETRRGRPRWARGDEGAGSGWSGSRPTSSTSPARAGCSGRPPAARQQWSCA